MGYALIAPLARDNSTSVVRICEALALRLASDRSASVSIAAYRDGEGECVRLKRRGWTLRIHVEEGPHVLEESRQVADEYGFGRSDRAAIGRCDRRITVDSDEDANMSNFNYYAACLEVIEQLGPVAMFDPHAEKFLD